MSEIQEKQVQIRGVKHISLEPVMEQGKVTLEDGTTVRRSVSKRNDLRVIFDDDTERLYINVAIVEFEERKYTRKETGEQFLGCSLNIISLGVPTEDDIAKLTLAEAYERAIPYEDYMRAKEAVKEESKSE